MGNIMLKLKRFLGNKNTVTIFCVVLGVAVLLIGYNYRVNEAVQPVSVPYALRDMEPKSKIEPDDVGTIKVSGAFVEQNPNLIKSKAFIVDGDPEKGAWYVHYDTKIPEGGLFYKNQLVTKDEIPDTAFDKIKDGEAPFSLSVNSHSTYGNSIMPGNYIDLYIKSTDQNGKVIFAKFIESIQVLAVKDANNDDVFANSEVERNSSELLFAVEENLFNLLNAATIVGGIDIIPVPRNEKYREEGNKGTGIQVSKQEIVNFIMEKLSELSDDININTSTLSPTITNPTTPTVGN